MKKCEYKHVFNYSIVCEDCRQKLLDAEDGCNNNSRYVVRRGPETTGLDWLQGELRVCGVHRKYLVESRKFALIVDRGPVVAAIKLLKKEGYDVSKLNK